MTETEWAIRNLELAGFFSKESDYEGMLGEAVKRLLEVHAKEGHSGGSHFQAIRIFCAVASGEALTMEYWIERFNAFNDLSKKMGGGIITEEEFEQFTKKPRRKKHHEPRTN